jgi:hypothetical protein
MGRANYSSIEMGNVFASTACCPFSAPESIASLTGYAYLVEAIRAL